MFTDRRTDFRAILARLAVLAACLAAAALAAPWFVGRNVTIAELVGVGAIVAVGVFQWRALKSRRDRERLDRIRDSALW